MNSEIRKLTKDEIQTFVDISANAYPGFMQNTPEFKENQLTNLVHLQENDESMDLFGLFREGKLVGGMRIHYYSMNLYSKPIDVGGVGFVAVDLLHKKEKVAKEMIQYFIQHFKERGTSLVMLYPFRPDFYKQMGFGYGTKMNQYQVEPHNFPNVVDKEGITYLDETHKELVRECYNRYAAKTHGMVYKTNNELNTLFKSHIIRKVGFMNGDRLEGYILFSFKKVIESTFLYNNLEIREMIYETPLAYAKLNAFIHSQADQIQRVIVNSQDDSLPHLYHDPRNGSKNIIPSVYHETNTSGVGLMYRIIDIPKFLSQLNPLSHITTKFRLKVIDSFLSHEPYVYDVSISSGEISIQQDQHSEFEIELDISDFSSLLMGSITVERLYQYGLLKLNDIEFLDTLERIFSNNKKPICVTAF